MKRNISIMMAVVFLLVPAIVLGMGEPGGYLPEMSAVIEGRLPAQVNEYISQHFPGREALARWSLAIRVLGGQREYNQIFISGDELIPVLNPPLDYQVRENTQAIIQFAREVRVPVYVMIIPTVSAIRQQSLPAFFLGQSVNQPQFIDEVYSALRGNVVVVDAYNALYVARDQYLFYRTENNLTALGGFHLYSSDLALGGSLLSGIARPSLQHYDIEFVRNDFLGDLYERSPFQNARADTLSIFRYRRQPREHLVIKNPNGERKTYHTLFPLHLLDLENNRPMDIFLGGLSAKTTITTSSTYRNNLLVLGDRTALSFVPFLANHYRTVTLLDLSQMGWDDYRAIAQLMREDFFSQILFAYSIDTYMHRPYPTWALGLLPAPDLDDYPL